MKRKTKHLPRLGHLSVFSQDPNGQARGFGQQKEWFLKALGRFVNTGDSIKDYEALSKAYPSMWPLAVIANGGRDLSWVPEGHRLFLFYRDLLRRAWTRDPVTLKNGTAMNLLFGTVEYSEMQSMLSGTAVLPYDFETAIAPLRNSYSNVQLPGAPVPLARFWQDWGGGTIEYVSQVDFQRAVWQLFKESWRAKVCPKCSTFFLVQKPAQMYCSLSCSTAVHRASSLSWWKHHGSKKRAARAKARRDERESR